MICKISHSEKNFLSLFLFHWHGQSDKSAMATSFIFHNFGLSAGDSGYVRQKNQFKKYFILFLKIVCLSVCVCLCICMYVWIQVSREARRVHQIPCSLAYRQLFITQQGSWKWNLILCKSNEHSWLREPFLYPYEHVVFKLILPTILWIFRFINAHTYTHTWKYNIKLGHKYR